MNENIKEIIAERIKYHSNKEKYGYFIVNSCIDICASDILEDVKKAGYRKESEVKAETAKTVREIYNKIYDNLPQACDWDWLQGAHWAMQIAAEYSKEGV